MHDNFKQNQWTASCYVSFEPSSACIKFCNVYVEPGIQNDAAYSIFHLPVLPKYVQQAFQKSLNALANHHRTSVLTNIVSPTCSYQRIFYTSPRLLNLFTIPFRAGEEFYCGSSAPKTTIF